MLGFLITALFGALLATAGATILRRVWPGVDPAEGVGLGALLGLGFVGWVTFFLGLVPGGIGWVWVPWLVALLGTGWAFRAGSPLNLWRFRRPADREVLFPAIIALLMLIGVINALAPSDSTDWDTLAYHLAVPKVWLAQGLASPIPFIHHSHFPFAVDNLYLWGSQWGGESGAKGFTWLFTVAGVMVIFGAVRRRWGVDTAPWATLAWAGAPIILWQSGSGYIDVAHGLFAGMAAVYLAERVTSTADNLSKTAPWIVIGALLGLAVGSKYTGLQTAALLAPLALIFGARRQGIALTLKGAAVVLALTAVIGFPWYIRNAVVAKNPVYPFFYERLGGANWDDWRASIYRDEQQTFGVGRTATGRDLNALPSAVLGLGYQPGRYINPNQTQGGGFPMGAIGAVLALAWPLWLTTGRSRRQPDALFLAIWVGLAFSMWYLLSQQARYIAALAPALVWLVAGLSQASSWRKVVPWLVVPQALITLALLYTVQTQTQLPVVLGRVDVKSYREARVPFARAAAEINRLGPATHVALFDEVFGYLLDVPYFWGNPGHGTFLPYDRLDSGRSWAESLKTQGITHVYVNLQYTTGADRDRWVQAMGLAEGGAWTAEERARMDRDPNLKWKRLLAEAAREHAMIIVPVNLRSGLLFQLQ